MVWYNVVSHMSMCNNTMLFSFLSYYRIRLAWLAPRHPESRAWAPLLQRLRGSRKPLAPRWREPRGNSSFPMGHQGSSGLVPHMQQHAVLPSAIQLSLHVMSRPNGPCYVTALSLLLCCSVQATCQSSHASNRGLCSPSANSGCSPGLQLS